MIEAAEKWGLEYTENINVYSEDNINHAQSLTAKVEKQYQ